VQQEQRHTRKSTAELAAIGPKLRDDRFIPIVRITHNYLPLDTNVR
jgi:hypothetical protein